MIQGRQDTYFTIDEFADMVGREPKTVRNWVSDGRLEFAHLCGVPLVSLATVENLITGCVPPRAEDGQTALRMIHRMNRRGQRTAPESRADEPPSSGTTR